MEISLRVIFILVCSGGLWSSAYTETRCVSCAPVRQPDACYVSRSVGRERYRFPDVFPSKLRPSLGLRFSDLGSPRSPTGSQLLDALEKQPSCPDCLISTKTHRGFMQ